MTDTNPIEWPAGWTGSINDNGEGAATVTAEGPDGAVVVGFKNPANMWVAWTPADANWPTSAVPTASPSEAVQQALARASGQNPPTPEPQKTTQDVVTAHQSRQQVSDPPPPTYSRITTKAQRRILSRQQQADELRAVIQREASAALAQRRGGAR